MISTRWLTQRQPYWTALEGLLDRVSRDDLQALTRSELRELGLLYRQVAADLGAAREDPGAVRIATYLNQLLVRAHHTIYRAERPTASALLGFFRTGFPRVFRATAAHTGVAAAIFVLAAAVGAALTWRNPDFQLKMLGPAMVETIERQEMWTHSIVAMKPIASSAIMTNNLSVALTAFAAGITLGLGTTYMMLLNGLLIGVIGAACAEAGMSLQLWSFVAPHGALELPAILIAGGSGLRLAHGLLFPGFLPRRVALAHGARQAVHLVLGCVPILVFAGVIEGFVSPTDLAVPYKFGVAAALFALLTLYLASGRERTTTAGSAA